MLTLGSLYVVGLAHRLQDLGYMDYLSRTEQPAMHVLVEAGYASHNLDSARRYEITEAGLAWLAEQEA